MWVHWRRYADTDRKKRTQHCTLACRRKLNTVCMCGHGCKGSNMQERVKEMLGGERWIYTKCPKTVWCVMYVSRWREFIRIIQDWGQRNRAGPQSATITTANTTLLHVLKHGKWSWIDLGTVLKGILGDWSRWKSMLCMLYHKWTVEQKNQLMIHRGIHESNFTSFYVIFHEQDWSMWETSGPIFQTEWILAVF